MGAGRARSPATARACGEAGGGGGWGTPVDRNPEGRRVHAGAGSPNSSVSGGRAVRGRDLDLRDPGDRGLLISAWLRYAASGAEDLSWAYGDLVDLIDEDPTLAWTVVSELVR